MAINQYKYSDVVVSTAAKTYVKIESSGIEIGRGKCKTRLNLSINTQACEAAKTAAHVYVEVIETGFCGKLKSWALSKMKKSFAPLQVKKGDKEVTIFVNIKSLSKRLGVEKENITKSVKNNTFDKLLCESQQRYFKHEEKVLLQYAAYLKNYNVKDNKIFTKSNQSTGISTTTLYKIMGISLIAAIPEGENYIKIKDRQVLFKKLNDQLEIFHFSGEVIGSGGFGRVELITELSKGVLSVVKIAKNRAGAKHDLINEYNILHAIHRNGQKIGIQRAPHLFIKIGKENPQQGYIAYQYDADLLRFSFANMSAKKNLDCAHQLLTGLAYCADTMNIAIRDIKPNNCLIKETDSGYECVLSDFGSSAVVNSDEPHWGPYTPHFVCEKDFETFEQLKKMLNSKNLKPKKRDRIILSMNSILKARDVYAMGMTLKHILKSNNLKDAEKIAIKQLIKKMKEPNHLKRLSASAALAELEKTIRDVK